MDSILIKFASIAVHAEELIEGLDEGDTQGVGFDVAAIQGLLADPEVRRTRDELEELALLPVKRGT
jgi:hypothetical protein